MTPFENPSSEYEPTFNRQLKLVMARHETVNKRFKDFEALSTRTFRHTREQHCLFFQAIAMIIQLSLQEPAGTPLG